MLRLQVADDHLSGRDPHTATQPLVSGAEARDPLQCFEPRADGAFGVIFIGARPAEVGEDTVPHILCHVAVEARDGTGHRVLIAGQDIAQELGIHALRQGRGADKVAKQDRQ